MATVKDSIIAAAAFDAGFRDNDLTVAVAIALAESGGNASATNRNKDGSTDYGLWQINSVHSSILASGQWSNPVDNAKMAHAVYADAHNRFTPWVTFTTGKYLVFMPRATQALKDIDSMLKNMKPLPDPGLVLPGQLGTIQDAGKKLTDPAFWRRIAYAIVGGILILWALFKMTGDNQLSEGTKAIAKLGAKAALA